MSRLILFVKIGGPGRTQLRGSMLTVVSGECIANRLWARRTVAKGLFILNRTTRTVETWVLTFPAHLKRHLTLQSGETIRTDTVHSILFCLPWHLHFSLPLLIRGAECTSTTVHTTQGAREGRHARLLWKKPLSFAVVYCCLSVLSVCLERLCKRQQFMQFIHHLCFATRLVGPIRSL